MTENQTLTQPTPRFNFARLIAVILRPRRAFAEIAGEEKPSWVTPLIVASVTVMLVVIVGGYVKSRAAMMGQVELPTDWQYWTPQMQEDYMAGQQATQSPAFLYVVPAVGALFSLWLGWLILGGLLHLGSTLVGGRSSMGKTLTVVAWASTPFILRDVLRIIFILATGHAIRSTGLSGFTDGSGFVSHLLALADLFVIWNAVLLILGFKIVDNLPTGKAIGAVVAVLLISLLAQAGLATVGSGIGSAFSNGF
jgi:hypothetical protein